ncbi:MAG TPA: ribosome recycling factor [Candidatus Faecenecus gallistercoris]|jgi:ribosome recycling factor|uniref:Ribosome-recycling factor n=1 Tax=Candidatus Faecenecus gallistercoris TaxID=2840793 RepID=A0A9D0YYJ6_9FIRM|nr:ribosome recycling factor [Bacillota bacterium]MDD7102334.1 ribosome recycling factor [Bacillota bacterium]MDY4050574.1 ribosome recycling factor [Candidatus Faecenecus gallistercoris]CDE08692.1 ribosome-recycling factor 2 [Bacillus sp. CAG:988]HIQ64210.1 ribosome recycling factor [Candidatus Faecenecus gallistercoris]
MNDEIKTNAKNKMIQSLEGLEKRFSTVRAGRANPSSLDGVMVDYYGTMTPLKSLGTISVPEGNQLLIRPFDKHCLGSMEKAIVAANLGYNPSNDGETLRIVIPALTEERRKELSKQVKAMAEEGKVAIRNIRRDAINEIDKLEDISEDIQKGMEKDIQSLTDEYNKKIEELLKEKEKELMTV